ncbi:unnamed protein product [Rotaria sordida]|uniref:U6 small nuclear RNA (adenine-(43)-N(6))-methyltransferase n=2 Tax=Rotaria sordida TaxID=392033 RepID=A0A818SKT5_9BILA|nr:unnamed protein product [Rotaria sordida]CAF0792220.1 unnamed protein product [Rotaria sordida]CAF3670505.1 unnamed protein product [Rotaria sordida]
MSFNEYMHIRNRYRTNPVDFKQLAEKHPALKSFLIEKTNGGVTLDFCDPNAVRALTIATAKEDFNLNLELSLDRLIPRIPQKLNYLHWIEDLIERKIDAIGIDIGCGCSCIHALLAIRLNPQWKMFVSEIDPFNYRMAMKNVEQNGLQDQIHVILMNSSALFDGLIDQTNHYDFLMCNPPFFSDTFECQGITNTRKFNRPSANSVNTAANIESIYDQGGEVEFVKRMINESRSYATNVRIFTSQLGKKSSLKQIQKYLQDIRHIDTELCQGNTMRWAIAWTFDETLHFPEQCQSREAFKGLQKTKKKEMNRTPISIQFESKYSFNFIKDYLEKNLFNELNLQWTSLSAYAWTFDAYENLWSHQRQRRRHQNDEQPPSKRLKSNDDQINKLCSIQARLDEHEGICSLYFLFVDGINADSANQIGQYIKNQFPKYCQSCTNTLKLE